MQGLTITVDELARLGALNGSGIGRRETLPLSAMIGVTSRGLWASLLSLVSLASEPSVMLTLKECQHASGAVPARADIQG
jgi:hypothetical protein